jgi:hypothetical protein
MMGYMANAPRGGKSRKRAYKNRRKAGNYLMEKHLKEMSQPRPITVTVLDPEIVRQHIKETAKN